MNILLLSVIVIVIYCIFVYFLSSFIVSNLTDDKPSTTQLLNVKNYCTVLKTINIILGVLFFIMLGISGYYFYRNSNKTFLLNVIKFGLLLISLTIVNILFVQSIEQILNSTSNVDLQKSKILATNDGIQKSSMFTVFLVILLYQFYVCNPSLPNTPSSPTSPPTSPSKSSPTLKKLFSQNKNKV